LKKDIRKVKAGDIVSLKDEQTLQDLFQSGNTALGIDLVVDNVLTITESHNIVTWKRIQFVESDIVLVIKDAGGDAYDVRVCFPPDEYEPGNRSDLCGTDWILRLFEKAEDDEQPLDSYEYIRSIDINYDDLGTIEYKIKGGTLYGRDNQDRFCSVTEWSASQDCPNPEIIAFEIGGDDSDDGGYIDLYQGVNLFPEEYEVL